VQKYLNKLQNPQTTFISLATFFGLIFCFIAPPFFALDESVHFNHAYQVSGGHIYPQKLNDKYYGGYINDKVDDSVLKSLEYRSKQPNFRTTFLDNFKERSKLPGSGKVMSIFNSTAVYPPIAYIPQATGILIGRILHLPTIYLLYLGRLFNLAVWIALVALAIRLMPVGKWALVVIALLPTSIVQVSSLSADAITISLAFITAAFVFKLALEKELLKTRQYLILGALVALLAFTKQSYFCFAFLVFALSPNKFQTKVSYWLKTLSIVMLSIVPIALWTWSVRKIDITLPAWPDHPPINASAQLHNFLHQPQDFGFSIWSSYLTGRGDITVNTFIGQFGRVYDLHLPQFIVILTYFIILLALLKEENIAKLKNTLRLRLSALGVLLMTLGILTTILYFTYSQIGGHYVDGIQARYFLPLMILLIPIFKFRNRRWLKIEVSSKLFVASSAGLLLISTVMMIHRFYYAWS
jgi:uncharacterized membrane protein